MPSRSAHLRLLLLSALLAVAGCAAPSAPTAAPTAAGSGTPAVAVVHKSADCACCKGHEEHLEAAGYRIEHVLYDDPGSLAEAKEGFGVPEAQRSCHTTLVGDYVVEGHMPAEEVALLLVERPAIDGIALAGMPAGAPGMPGAKNQDWTIWALADGTASIHAVR